MLERCSESGEALYADGRGMVRLNAHAHTVASDGAVTMQELAAIAECHSVNIAVTDHNRPPEPPGGRMPDGLAAGVEVNASGVDVVVLGPLERVHRFFARAVRHLLHPQNPIFRPTRARIRDVLAAAREEECHCIHPHYAGIEGLSMLPPEEQFRALEASSGMGFVEVSAMQDPASNGVAEALAEEWALPLLYTGDTHREEEQYAGTGSAVPIERVHAQGKGPLITRFLKALRGKPPEVEHRLHRLTLAAKLRTGLQVVWKNRFVPIAVLAAKMAGRAARILPRPHRGNLPGRKRGIVLSI